MRCSREGDHAFRPVGEEAVIDKADDPALRERFDTMHRAEHRTDIDATVSVSLPDAAAIPIAVSMSSA